MSNPNLLSDSDLRFAVDQIRYGRTLGGRAESLDIITDHITALTAQLAAEKQAREQAEAERDHLGLAYDHLAAATEHIKNLKAERDALGKRVEALEKGHDRTADGVLVEEGAKVWHLFAGTPEAYIVAYFSVAASWFNIPHRDQQSLRCCYSTPEAALASAPAPAPKEGETP